MDGEPGNSANEQTFRLDVGDGVSLFVYRWEPVISDKARSAKAVVQISHGMGEHGARYARLAQALCAAGYAVYVSDHRGHGKSVKSASDLGYFADDDGMTKVVADQERLRQRIEQDHPGLPLFIFAHSMGSFVMRRYLFEHSDKVAGAVLSGTSGGQVGLAKAGRAVAKLERMRLGPRGHSALLHAMSFKDYNNKFRPARTDADWLSRDPIEVDKYVADPLCGFTLSAQGWVDLLGTVIAMQDVENVKRMRKDLPLYVFSGSDDPVGANTVGVKATLDVFKRAGLSNVTHRFYPSGRHEMLNETNRDEVTRDLIAWLDDTFSKLAR